MHNAKQEFSRFANSYQYLNIIQREVAKELIDMLDFAPKSILDLGSGSGEIYKNLSKFDFETFTAVDISPEMCQLHPKSSNIQVINSDFESEDIFRNKFDLIISSSAIQWSKDIDSLFAKISKSSTHIAFAIFTSQTFFELNLKLNLKSLLYSTNFLVESLNRYFNFKYELKNYTLEFESTIELLRYIKQSGISGGVKRISHKNLKEFIAIDELKKLDFEVLFVVGSIKDY